MGYSRVRNRNARHLRQSTRQANRLVQVSHIGDQTRMTGHLLSVAQQAWQAEHRSFIALLVAAPGKVSARTMPESNTACWQMSRICAEQLPAATPPVVGRHRRSMSSKLSLPPHLPTWQGGADQCMGQHQACLSTQGTEGVWQKNPRQRALPTFPRQSAGRRPSSLRQQSKSMCWPIKTPVPWRQSPAQHPSWPRIWLPTPFRLSAGQCSLGTERHQRPA